MTQRLPAVASPPVLITAALAVAATLVAAWFGWSWWSAAHDESAAFSRDRDQVLRVGEQAVVGMNTLDYRSVQPGLASWQSLTTGDLHDQLVRDNPSYVSKIQEAKTATTAKLVDAAVTELDQHAGRAAVLAVLDITVTPQQGQPVTKRNRFQGQLTRTDAGWKLSALGQVPVGTAQ
ncbi:hypothetical protein GCM10010174_16760 [Kutzneria viridogrisea]|uniref:Mce-associated membrane protein n=2 Tax=Kutzneria TaxID=43356 RepID=W5WEW5_9PSEU|nr:hypothetical protein [Kutzneria albida]AHH99748.1 hypothetical protein KALB_6388 [Kutzneria albida DSM 43870]MBA8924925.1 Mce-associated membrane protein [Kutzneria viridogrisea]